MTAGGLNYFSLINRPEYQNNNLHTKLPSACFQSSWNAMYVKTNDAASQVRIRGCFEDDLSSHPWSILSNIWFCRLTTISIFPVAPVFARRILCGIIYIK